MEKYNFVKNFPSVVFWCAFSSLLIAAWGLMAQQHTETHEQLHHAHHPEFISVLQAWMLMGVAMMLPTAFPLIKDYEALIKSKPSHSLLMASLIIGYVSMWLLFAVPTSVLQHFFQQNAMLNNEGVFTQTYFSAALLIFAGAYQFSPLKQMCVKRCRNTTAFLMMHWRAGAYGALRLGVQHGVFCVGCCWALMLLGFVMGLHSLWWMGFAMIFMLLEKLPQIGKFLDLPAGLILICWGMSLMVINGIKL